MSAHTRSNGNKTRLDSETDLILLTLCALDLVLFVNIIDILCLIEKG